MKMTSFAGILTIPKEHLSKASTSFGCLYQVASISLPIGFELISKTEHYIDPKDLKEKRRSRVSKNQLARIQIEYAVRNKVKFRFVLFDVWFSSVENLRFILKNRKHFICPLKSNRKVALSKAAKLAWTLAQIGNLGNHTKRKSFDIFGRLGNSGSPYQTGFHQRKRTNSRSVFDAPAIQSCQLMTLRQPTKDGGESKNITNR